MARIKSTEFFNTKYGNIALTNIYTTCLGDETYECYDETDRYYGMITFKAVETIDVKSIETKLNKLRN